jgi:FkbM family methyltransferase
MTVNLAGEQFEASPNPFWADAESGRWEPYTFEVLAKYLPKHSTYLDVGAWIGPTVLYASRFCDRVMALEPDPVAFDILRENVKMSKSKAFLLQGALMDYNGKVLLGSEDLGNSMTRLEAARPDAKVIETDCRTLSQVDKLLIFTAPLFIKMDCEGAEEFILRDKSFFEHYKPTLYLSLHPQWFRNPTTAMETINGIGALYANRIEVANNTLLFTDL